MERTTCDPNETSENGTITARLDLLAWLILAFRAPTEEAWSELRSRDPRLLLRRAELLPSDRPRLHLGWRALPAREALPRLQEEHVRLFHASRTSPVAPLDALSYLGDREGERTAFLADLAAELYRRGLHPDPDRGLPPDHLTLLLELLYACEGLAGAAERSALVDRFFRTWVPRFLRRLASARPTSFYADAARVLAAVLVIDDDPFRPETENLSDAPREDGA